GAVTLQRVGTDRTTVIEVLQDLEALENDVMTFLALDVGDETHATGIVFIGGVVQTLLLGQIHLLFLKRHARSRVRGRTRPCPQASADKPNAHKKAGRARTGFV